MPSKGQGHVVVEARDEPEAVLQLRQARPAVVLTDLKLPEGDGFGVLRAAKDLDSQVVVVVMTAYGSIQDAVMAMKEGALDFLAKPVDPDHLLLIVARALAQRRMHTEYILLKEELAERRGAPRIIGEDAHLRQVSQQLPETRPPIPPCCSRRERTGKDCCSGAARAHPRAEASLCDQCAAIPETLPRRALRPREGPFPARSRARRDGSSCASRHAFLDEIEI